MSSNYKKVIAKLYNIDTSPDAAFLYRALVYDIASQRPSAILNALHEPHTLTLFMQQFIIPVYSRIACIKIYRAITDEGLKEAKTHTEEIQTGEWGKTVSSGTDVLNKEVQNYKLYMQK